MTVDFPWFPGTGRARPDETSSDDINARARAGAERNNFQHTETAPCLNARLDRCAARRQPCRGCPEPAGALLQRKRYRHCGASSRANPFHPITDRQDRCRLGWCYARSSGLDSLHGSWQDQIGLPRREAFASGKLFHPSVEIFAHNPGTTSALPAFMRVLARVPAFEADAP